MKKMIAIALVACAMCGFAADKKVAVFVQNKTNIPALDAQTESIRERIVAAFAEIPGFQIVDSTLALDAFKSAPNITQALGCDYVAVATMINASSVKRNVGGRLSTVFTLRMSFKITDSSGVSVDGMPTWKRSFPVIDAVDDPSAYYEQMLDDWESDMTAAVAAKAEKWRNPTPIDSRLVSFYVSTSIDKTVAELESATKGANGEQLVELRKVVGGVSVAIDGVVVGSAPGNFQVTPGLHKITVSRAWMTPYETTLNVRDGMNLDVALELSAEGLSKWGTAEAMRADLARRYAQAAAERNIKINLDSKNWRDVGAPPALKITQ